MFFSKNLWKTTDNVNKIIPVSAALSFEKLESALISADEIYLKPLLGSELVAQAEAIYEKDEPTDTELLFLSLMKTAELNLAMYYDFQELNIRITDQGFQRQNTENFTSAYKYQEDALRHSFQNKGFNALDRILDFLEANSDTFPDYTSSPAYVSVKTRFVRSPKEVNDVFFINSSRLVFLRLWPIFTELEETLIPHILGSSLFIATKDAFESGVTDIGSTTVEELRLRCVRLIVSKAIAQLARQTGEITNRGLYFHTKWDMNDLNEPASHERAANLAANAEQSALNYSAALTAFIQTYLSSYYVGHDHSALDRDNDHHRTFFA